MRRYQLLYIVALGGCTVGPNYSGPTAVTPPAKFVRADGVDTAAMVPIGPWWKTLHDPVLDELIRRGLASNPDVAVATARLRQARGSLRLERANGLPNGNASALYLHGELPPTNLGAIGSSEEGGSTGSSEAGRTSLDFYNIGFDASWEVDLFGGKRRAREATRATLEAADARLSDVQVSLSAEIAQAYVNLRDRQQRLLLAQAQATLDRRLLDLSGLRIRAGTMTAADLLPLRRQLENSDAGVLPLVADRSAYLNALAVLCGEAPGSLDQLLSAVAPVPLPPTSVPVGDPAALIARRPDIRAAERTLASQTAKIGVAEAARFPKLSFAGVIGIGGSDPSDLLAPDNLTALALPRLAWNILDFGRNAGRLEQARGIRDEAEAEYRGAVLLALRDAENALARFAADRSTLANLLRQQRIAEEAEQVALRRYRGGTARVTDTIDAQRQRLASEQSVTQARANLTNDFVALQKSLGLGWQTAI